MKILVAAARTPDWPKYDWVETAIRNLGHEAMRAGSAKELRAMHKEADLVILGQRSLAGRWPNIRDIVHSRQCPFVQWWFDLITYVRWEPVKNQPVVNQFFDVMSSVDIAFVKERKLLDEYREMGINAHYLDQGCPSDYPEIERGVDYKYDFILWGQCNEFYRRRSQHVRHLLRKNYRVAWCSNEWTVPPGAVHLPWTPPYELPRVASQARFVLSIDRTLNMPVEGYHSDRLLLACGMGAAVLNFRVHESPLCGPVSQYTTMTDLSYWVDLLWDHVEDNGKSLRQWIMEENTYEHRIMEMLDILVDEGLLAGSVVEQEALSFTRMDGDVNTVASAASGAT